MRSYFQSLSENFDLKLILFGTNLTANNVQFLFEWYPKLLSYFETNICMRVCLLITVESQEKLMGGREVELILFNTVWKNEKISILSLPCRPLYRVIEADWTSRWSLIQPKDHIHAILLLLVNNKLELTLNKLVKYLLNGPIMLN